MTEPTTESHAEVQAAFDAFRHEVSEAMHVIQEYLNGRSNAAFTVSLATPSGMVNFDRFLIPEPVDPLVQMFRTLPLNGDAGCDKLTDAEWLIVANAARTELAKIGWQVGPIETPAAPEPAPVDPNHTEAVELVLALPVERTDNQKQAIRDGFAGRLQVAAAIAGIKRGMELTPAKPAIIAALTAQAEHDKVLAERDALAAKLSQAWKAEGDVVAQMAAAEITTERNNALQAENARLREANGILEDALQEVGDDYPGSSCQEWCIQQIKAARAALEAKP